MSETRTPGTLADQLPAQRVWTPTFVVFVAYMFVILTHRLPGGTILMVLALISLALQREALRAPRFLWFFAAWILWAGLGYAVTPYPDRVWASLMEHGKIFLVALVAVNALRTPSQIRYFMLFVLASYLLFPIRSTLQNYVTGYTLGGRAVGPFIYANPNDLASATILMLGPALAVWASAAPRSLSRWIAWGAAAALLVTIVLTQSRGAFLALIALAMPSGIALARHRPRVVPLFVALVVLTLVWAPAALWQRLAGLSKATSAETIGEMDPEGSARQRFAVLQTAVRIVGDRPMLGVGIGAYAHANRDYNPALGMLDTHNTYLNVAAETGLPGLALFLTLVASVLRDARDARRRVRRASPAQAEALRWLLYGLVGYLITGLFASFARLAFPYVYLGLLWSASQAALAQCWEAGRSESLRTPSDPTTAPV